jgi:hypothetical protein
MLQFGDGKSFSPLRFSIYARDLKQAILGLRPMGATEQLRQALHRNDVDVRFGAGRQFVTMDGKTVELDAAASTAEVAQALNITPMPSVEIAPKPIDDVPASNITGIQSGAFQDALAQMRSRIAGKQKQAVDLIASSVAAGEAKMDAAAKDVATKVDKEIAAALQEFAPLTNGGPS